jgi:hypothetical protein
MQKNKTAECAKNPANFLSSQHCDTHTWHNTFCENKRREKDTFWEPGNSINIFSVILSTWKHHYPRVRIYQAFFSN